MIARYGIQSPRPSGSGAIEIVQVRGDVDAVLRRLGTGPVAVGGVGLREVEGVDTMVVARPTPTHALVFPHAGQAVTERVRAALERAGAAAEDDADRAETAYPEAASVLEARLLAELARAQSPLAIDLLLDQPRRWAAVDEIGEMTEAENAVLRRLIDAPVVAALGPPNVGKSSLLNTLAGRGVSVVADEPGTTRDHVGVMLDLGGLVVHYLDTPGLTTGETDPVQREAQALALRAAAGADLVLACGDGLSGFLPPALVPSGVAVLRVGLRADLGPAPLPDAEAGLAVSVRDNRGVDVLVREVRERLVPRRLLEDRRAWGFWGTAGGAACGEGS